MRKFRLLNSTVRGYRPSIRLGKHGHPMRDPEDHGNPGGGSDNGGGNSSTPGGDSQQQNNGGQEFDYSSFWSSPGDGEGETPRAGESAGSSTPASGQQQQEQQPANPAAELGQAIQGLTFDGVFNDNVMAELAEGKTDSFNQNMNKMGQQAVTQAIKLILPILGQMRDGLRSEMQTNVQGNNVTRDNEAALLKAIPSASDPKVRPMVDRIFQQSLKHSNNDRTKALAMTKDMIRIQAEMLGQDVGLPPRTSGDSYRNTTNVDWMDELAGRN